MFGRSKEQLSGSTLDDEKNLLETIPKLSKDEVKSAFVHWKENAMGRRPQRKVLSELTKRQATLISFHLIRDPETENFLSTL
jgi:hypothetical protein